MSILKVYGPPGTGKTTFIKNKIEESGIPTSSILAISYTKNAAWELKSRLGIKGKDHWFRTQHSVNLKMLGWDPSLLVKNHLKEFRELHSEYEFPPEMLQEPKETGDEVDSFSFDITEVDDERLGEKFFKVYIAERERLLELGTLIDADLKNSYMRFIERYCKWKRDNKYFDFTDLLIEGTKKALVPQDIKLYVHDEYQDCTPLQHLQAEFWRSVIETSLVVGDPDQAIFTFAGASPELFYSIQADEKKHLTQSYRCPKIIGVFAQKIINENKNREKVDWLARDEDGSIDTIYELTEIKRILDKNPNKTYMFLARNRYALNIAKDSLRELGVPVGIQQRKKDVASLFLRNKDFFTASDLYILSSNIFPQKRYFKHGSKKKLDEEAEFLLSNSFAEDGGIDKDRLIEIGALPTLFEDMANKNMDNLKGVSSFDLDYYTSICLNYPEKVPDIKFQTIHRAKGSEADVVFLMTDIAKKTWEEEVRGDIEAERRVWYVGVTRARESLFILSPQLKSKYSTTII